MVDAPLGSTFPPRHPTPDLPEQQAPSTGRGRALLVWSLCLVLVALAAWAVVLEARTSWLQSLLAARFAGEMTVSVAPGANRDARFPGGGPYDERLGYVALPSMIGRLESRHFAVTREARLSPRLDAFMAKGGYAIYHEKSRAGLTLTDRAGRPIYAASFPRQAYADFAAIPSLVADTLLFIEDQHLLDADPPERNPAVDWKRFVLASVGQLAGVVDPHLKQGGASTLATQIEKFRHSAEGRTGGTTDKLRQMLTATARAYADGRDTSAARRAIVTSYLNSTPLASRPGYGEVIGVPDGLEAWYGTMLAEASAVLTRPADGAAALARKATVYKQVVSLLIAQRRPAYYLANAAALAQLTDEYLRLLGAAGVIDARLRDAALAAELRFLDEAPPPPPTSFVGRKAADAVRTELLSLLGVPSHYTLDRLDLSGKTTLDAPAQRRVTDVLARLGDPDTVKSLGMVGRDLLGAADPARVTYSVVLYERGADRNYLRVHADSLDEPFDINSGAKLILGSTAKLRTLVTYLEIVAELNARLAAKPVPALQRLAASGGDPLTRWAAAYLAAAGNRGLGPMLDAAMQRRYSGNPGEIFFTGGGAHTFHNFERKEDFEAYTVEEAFKHSVNLAFIRIMRDLVHYYMAQEGGWGDNAAAQQAPTREDYLARFADEEGRRYLNRFYDVYRRRTAEDALNVLAGRTRPIARRLAVAFRSVRPEADEASLGRFLASRLPETDGETVATLYRQYAPDRFSLGDRAFLAGVHPLELWLVAFLREHPKASRGEVLEASAAERQEAYRWLFKTRSAHKQDVRIRILREEDAFDQILGSWRRQGYAFQHLVPSFATAIGSSGDRPDSLAHLMGILVNDGVELPTVDVERLHFAADTPYETELAVDPAAPRRVLAPEVAATARRALLGVVAQGTGTRVRGVYKSPDGVPLAVGGKTGTGDNRFERTRAVDRTGTFVFFLGERFFGTVTAHVRGEEAAQYHFTSALAVQLLKALAPDLQPLLDTPAAAS